MYNYHHSFKEPPDRTGRKRPVLLVIGLFVLALVFASGFIVGIKFGAKREGLTILEQAQGNEDLTFYPTLTNRKHSTVGLEAKQSKVKTQDSFKGKEDLNKIYTIQVGAYKEIAVAEKVMNRLKKKGYRAYILEKVIPQQGIIYKVRVGEFPNREKAEELARGLKENEKMDSFVTLK